MRPIAWDGVKFSLGAELVDQSVLTYVDKPEAPALSLTVTQEKLEGGKPALLRYVDEQLKEISKQAPGFTVSAQSERKLGAAGAIPAVYVQALMAGAGKRRLQHQLYVLDERNARVVVVNVTALEGATATTATTLIDEIAKTLSVE